MVGGRGIKEIVGQQGLHAEECQKTEVMGKGIKGLGTLEE